MTKEQQIYSQAKRLGVCDLMKGGENTDDLMELFFTPQGIEFCSEYNFPSMEALMPFRGTQAARGGFYIDTPVKLKNPNRVALFGKDTVAELEYDDVSQRHEVVVMHGAKAIIKASGYAVVFVANVSGKVETEITESAMIL
jgi:hypothetical protein